MKAWGVVNVEPRFLALCTTWRRVFGFTPWHSGLEFRGNKFQCSLHKDQSLILLGFQLQPLSRPGVIPASPALIVVLIQDEPFSRLCLTLQNTLLLIFNALSTAEVAYFDSLSHLPTHSITLLESASLHIVLPLNPFKQIQRMQFHLIFDESKVNRKSSLITFMCVKLIVSCDQFASNM
jgi:hypothetical protein